jgi:hypothetical protein
MKSKQQFRAILFFMLVLFSNVSFSQTEEQAKKKTVLQFLGGETPEESITFMPGGTHLRNRDYVEVWYVGVQYKFLEYMAFKNSFGDSTAGVLFKRTLPFTSRLSINYGAGLMIGYNRANSYFNT